MSSSSAARHGRSTAFFPRLTGVARAAMALLGGTASRLMLLSSHRGGGHRDGRILNNGGNRGDGPPDLDELFAALGTRHPDPRAAVGVVLRRLRHVIHPFRPRPDPAPPENPGDDARRVALSLSVTTTRPAPRSTPGVAACEDHRRMTGASAPGMRQSAVV